MNGTNSLPSSSSGPTSFYFYLLVVFSFPHTCQVRPSPVCIQIPWSAWVNLKPCLRGDTSGQIPDHNNLTCIYYLLSSVTPGPALLEHTAPYFRNATLSWLSSKHVSQLPLLLSSFLSSFNGAEPGVLCQGSVLDTLFTFVQANFLCF